jgi:hypothetical protein
MLHHDGCNHCLESRAADSSLRTSGVTGFDAIQYKLSQGHNSCTQARGSGYKSRTHTSSTLELPGTRDMGFQICLHYLLSASKHWYRAHLLRKGGTQGARDILRESHCFICEGGCPVIIWVEGRLLGNVSRDGGTLQRGFWVSMAVLVLKRCLA